MKLGYFISFIPAGVLDHIRVYFKDTRVMDLKRYEEYKITVIAPSIHCESSKCKCIYDCYIDVYIQDPEELPF